MSPCSASFKFDQSYHHAKLATVLALKFSHAGLSYLCALVLPRKCLGISPFLRAWQHTHVYMRSHTCACRQSSIQHSWALEDSHRARGGRRFIWSECDRVLLLILSCEFLCLGSACWAHLLAPASLPLPSDAPAGHTSWPLPIRCASERLTAAAWPHGAWCCVHASTDDSSSTDSTMRFVHSMTWQSKAFPRATGSNESLMGSLSFPTRL